MLSILCSPCRLFSLLDISHITRQQSLRGAVADSEDLDLALEYAADYPKVDVYSDYDFDPEEEDADLDLDLYDEDGEEDELGQNDYTRVRCTPPPWEGAGGWKVRGGYNDMAKSSGQPESDSY